MNQSYSWTLTLLKSMQTGDCTIKGQICIVSCQNSNTYMYKHIHKHTCMCECILL